MTRANLPQPPNMQSPPMEAIVAVTAAHGAVDVAGGVVDVASGDSSAAVSEEESVPPAVPQMQHPPDLLDLPPDISRFCYPENRSRSISAGHKHRCKKPIRPRPPPKFYRKIALDPWLLSPQLFRKTNRSSLARRVPSLSTRSTKKSAHGQKIRSTRLLLR